MKNEMLETFLRGYWDFARWIWTAVGLIFLLMLTVMRRPGKAFAIVFLTLYVTVTYYFMSNFETMGMSLEFALGAVVIGGLIMAAGFYYFFFVRTE